MTYSLTTSSTFTRTGAKYIASKVVADLQALKDYYGNPSESRIRDYEKELTELLVGGYVASVEYGFMRENQRIVALRYEVRSDGSLSDKKSGGVYARANISNSKWFSFLIHSNKWDSLSAAAKQQINLQIHIKRVSGNGPQDGNGHWVTDRSYSSQGVGAQRQVFRP